MWHLLQASPLQISPFGAYPLWRSLHPQGYQHPHYISLLWGGPTTESCCEPAGSDAVDSRVTGSNFAGSGAEGYSVTGSYAVSSKVTSPTATGSSDGATLVPATPILWELASNPISAGGAAASQAQGERSHL